MFPELPQDLAEGEPVALGDRTVRFYEVYWADLLKGERIVGTFDLEELSSLAWFPLFNQIYKAYAQEPYPLLKVSWWAIILPPAGFALLILYWGARLLASLWEALREPLRNKSRRSRDLPELSGKTFFERIKFYADKGVEQAKPFERLLDEYAGDVLNYINSAGDTFASGRPVPDHLRHIYRDIVDRFYDQLARAHNDGCRFIQVVSHSLGTVVMYHALRGHRLDESTYPEKQAVAKAMRSINHIYTIGSPLEKIRFFWPKLRPTGNLVGERVIPWDNFVSYCDPVAGVLRRYAEWGQVTNHRLLGGGFISGHVVYERSSVFLETFARGLLDKSMTLHQTTGQRIKDLAILFGETLLAPMGLLMLLIAGTTFWIASAALVPFLLSLPFRPFVAPETWGPIVDYGLLLFVVLFLFVFSVSPVLHAKQALSRLRGKGVGERAHPRRD